MSLIKRNVFLLGNSYSQGVPYPYYSDNYIRKERYAGGEGHYGYPDFPADRNVGGDLNIYSASHTHTPSPSAYHWRGGANNDHYIGSFVTNVEADSFLGVNRDGASWGAEAYNKMKPTKPTFETLNFLYEMKDIPMLLKSKFEAKGLHELGSFHLGMQFGFLNLLRDTRNFVQTQRVAQKRLKWLLQHNGKPVRRKVTLAETMTTPTTSTGSTYGCLLPILVTQYYPSVPFFRHTRYDTDRVWASARFRYWLPGGPRDINWTKKMLYRIYGIKFPSPSVVYNAIPWSWLVDYFGNLGDVIANLDAGVANRLAADYFYVMRQFTVHEERVSHGRFYANSSGDKFSIIASTVREYSQKSRLVGDPFGFNTNQNSLTGMQLSILGALGLSKLR